MKRHLASFHRYGMIVLAWGLLVVLLTTLPGDLPVMRALFSVTRRIRFSDTIGHAALFGISTALIWQLLHRWLRPHHALLLAMATVLAVGASTEVYQWYVASRSASMSDMLANWLGVFIVGFVISYRQRDIQ